MVCNTWEQQYFVSVMETSHLLGGLDPYCCRLAVSYLMSNREIQSLFTKAVWNSYSIINSQHTLHLSFFNRGKSWKGNEWEGKAISPFTDFLSISMSQTCWQEGWQHCPKCSFLTGKVIVFTWRMFHVCKWEIKDKIQVLTNTLSELQQALMIVLLVWRSFSPS